MCRVTSPLTRRAVLRGGIAVTVGTVAAVTVSACDSGPSPEQITAAALVPLADAALADQAAAQALAPRTPEYANALGVVAEQRGEHARVLREEITRLDEQTAGRIAATPGAASSPAASASPGSSPVPTPAPAATTVDALRTQLARSARTAGAASVDLSGYSAGLAGAVSASVTSMVEVQLG
ncbi:hypothetical protein GTV32_05960 [Gordonia sp. SID5947]|uniref:hypothetical protein n=1 Tax=Gordonia sp. SID5947 TaxID=2690315 RepID=UPI001370CBD4|nr:hypothetical protein [Gordonia sp. SID5947]MYR05888.1 hypothetical protein [Gordonia sp. SID5947]